MTPVELKDLFRSDVRDDDNLNGHNLWSDVEVYSYMDDAQSMFCRLTGGIADSSSTWLTLAVAQNDVWVPYDRRILKLRAVTRGSDFRSIPILNMEDLGSGLGLTDYGNPITARFTNNPGPANAVITGLEANKIRLTAPASGADTLQLIVYRLPLETITVANAASVSLEIDVQHHRHLLDWMKCLAHKKQDAETYDRGRSDQFSAAFSAYCSEAKAERERREHKYRTVAYGGY